jgi:prevent-host-death family protein
MTPKTISATEAKLRFGALMGEVKDGTPVIIERNATPEIVWISIDDFEDYLETKDDAFQKTIKQAHKQIKNKKGGNLDNLYKIHRQTIAKEAK